MLLTIDAGNTRTKWAVFSGNGEITQQGSCFNDALLKADLTPQALGYQRVIISNVAGVAHADKLEQLLTPYDLPIDWVKASAQACNVTNGYIEPETLGTDRWAALIAAWHMQHAPCIVVNAGTAVTIDALAQVTDDALTHATDDKAEFIGGMILPGLNLMQASLGIATAQLPKHNAIQNFNTDTITENAITDIFAKSTAQAIYVGALHAVSGAITRMAEALKNKCGVVPLIVLSGGNAAIINKDLAETVTNETVIVDNLVLTGLYLLNCSKQ